MAEDRLIKTQSMSEMKPDNEVAPTHEIAPTDHSAENSSIEAPQMTSVKMLPEPLIINELSLKVKNPKSKKSILGASMRVKMKNMASLEHGGHDVMKASTIRKKPKLHKHPNLGKKACFCATLFLLIIVLIIVLLKFNESKEKTIYKKNV